MISFAFRTAGTISLGACFLLTGCLEDEGGGGIKNVEEKLEAQGFDLERAKEAIAKQKDRLAEYQEFTADRQELARLKKKLAELDEGVAQGSVRNEELRASFDEASEELRKHQTRYRVILRKDAIGGLVDLSSTKGPNYAEVKVSGINPIEVKIFSSSGPESIPYAELPKSLQEKWQLNDDEAARYRESVASNTEARAEHYRKWKSGLGARKDGSKKEVIAARVVEIQNEINQREKVINENILKIKDLKSRASQWEGNSGAEIKVDRKKRALRFSQVYRDQAQEITDLNSISWLLIARLQAELRDLKELQLAEPQ